MSTIAARRLTKTAGFEARWSIPVTLAGGNVADLDVAAMFVRGSTGASTTAQTAVSVTASDDDPSVGEIAVTLSVPDTQPADNYVLRVDVDKPAGAGPLDNVEIEVVVKAASAQRPAP